MAQQYTLTLESEEDYTIIKKLLKAFKGASIRPLRFKDGKVMDKETYECETLKDRLMEGFHEVHLIKSGVIEGQSARDFINEL
ncbi:MAG: hypothetical protein K2M10_06570 [Muribaculaceae bacterium]|nr:hypothetical protein [Muribaculaceae bacterium]